MSSDPSPDDLRSWLGTCPSIVVLDGLDEVPPAANRGNVIAAINALWDDLNLAKADAIVIVTTRRPQGYNHDLDPTYWEHWELGPLTTSYATRFAQRLSEVRLSNLQARDEIVKQIEVAADEEATKSLVTSPLQVAIMFGIVLLKGAIPKDRWELFDRYYTLLRDREAQKPGSIVREFKRQIDVLHQEVGFLLHVAAETEGNSVSFISPKTFNGIIRRLLVAEDFPEADVDRIASEIERTATDRLVFLAARVTGQIAFDVRSLQEFMAAGQITSASSVNLVERLRSICTSPHWRNVFRIAASKIFSVADFGHYRDDVVGICHGLDSGDFGDEFRLTRAGAQLALELLADGLAISAPRFRKALLRRALALLDLSLEATPAILLAIVADENLEIFEDEVSARLRQGNTLAAGGGFRFLFDVLPITPSWAEGLILRHWPADAGDALKMFARVSLVGCPDAIFAKLRQDQWSQGPAASVEFISARRGECDRRSTVLPEAYLQLMHVHTEPGLSEILFRRLETKVVSSADGSIGLGLPIVSVQPSSAFSFTVSEPPTAAWTGAFALAAFMRGPSKQTLAAVFHALGENSESAVLSQHWPWVTSFGSQLVDEGMSYADVASACTAGVLGDFNDWVAAERRWLKVGITRPDWEILNEEDLDAKKIAEQGAPLVDFRMVRFAGFDKREKAQFFSVLAEIRHPLRQLHLVHSALFMIHDQELFLARELEVLSKVITALVRRLPEPKRVELIARAIESDIAPYGDLEFLSELDSIGRSHAFSYISVAPNFRNEPDPRAVEFSIPSHLRGALVFVAKLALVGRVSAKQVSPKDLGFQDGDSEAVRIAVAVLKIIYGSWDMPEMQDVIVPLLQSPDISEQDFSRILAVSQVDSRAFALLSELAKHSGVFSSRKLSYLSEALKPAVDRLRSPLASEEQRVRLVLPSMPKEARSVRAVRSKKPDLGAGKDT